MGAALTQAAIDAGHDVIVVSGPVGIRYPDAAKVIDVVTTDEMLECATRVFKECEGAIGAAAPCDYMPRFVEESKIAKTGEALVLELIETPDIVATLGQTKRNDQWVVGFALETEDRRFRATVKLEKKHCDMIVSNGPQAIDAADNEVELLDAKGHLVESIRGDKPHVAQRLLEHINQLLVK